MPGGWGIAGLGKGTWHLDLALAGMARPAAAPFLEAGDEGSNDWALQVMNLVI